MGDEATSTLFSMAGFRVLAVDEYGSENVLVELSLYDDPTVLTGHGRIGRDGAILVRCW